MVDTDIFLSNTRRFRELPIEARHSICLEIAKRKRQSVATSIFIPKEFSRKIRFLKKNQKREKIETATHKQKLKKLTAEKKYSMNKLKNNKKNISKAKRQTKQRRKQYKLPGTQTQIQLHALKHPESYPIIKPTITSEKIRSVLDSLREGGCKEEPSDDDDSEGEDYQQDEQDYQQEKQDYHQEVQLHQQEKQDYQQEVQLHQQEKQDYQQEVQLHQQEKQDYQQEKQDYHQEKQDYHQVEQVHQKEENHQKEQVQLEEQVKKEQLQVMHDTTSTHQHLMRQTKLVEEQIQLGSEQRMTISYMVELPVDQAQLENSTSHNFAPKVETCKELTSNTPQHSNFVGINTLYAKNELAQHQNVANTMAITAEKHSKKDSYLRGYNNNYTEHFNQPALASGNALMPRTDMNWNMSYESQLQQALLPMRNTNVEQTNAQSYQRLMPRENTNHQKTRASGSTNICKTLDPLHNNFHMAHASRGIQFNIDTCQQQQKQHHHKQQYLMSHATTNFIDHNIPQIPDNTRGLAFFPHSTYPYFYHQQQQRLPAIDNSSLQPPPPPQPPPAAPPNNYMQYYHDRITYDSLLHKLNSQERRFTNSHDSFSPWHRPIGTAGSSQRNLPANSRRTYPHQEHQTPINIQHQQNISTATYADYIPRLQEEYLYDRSTYHQACNNFSNLPQHYPMDLTIPMPMPVIPTTQYRHPHFEYQIPTQQQYYSTHRNYNSCISIPAPRLAAPRPNFNPTVPQIQSEDFASREHNEWLLNKQREFFYYSGIVDRSGNNNNNRNIRTM